MRHLNAGNKLNTNASHRKALLRGLTLSLLEHDSIHTTRARAKELRWWADHAVTLAKRGDVASRRQLIKLLGSTETYRQGENRVRSAIGRLFADIAPRFKDRSGGYTQIIRLARPRAGDCAEMCIMRYLMSETGSKKGAKKEKSAAPKKKEAASKKVEAADRAPKTQKSAAEEKPATKRKAKSAKEE
ncbi:MAG: 50S ribosomal protein L17 [Deltaproteobacteria bacterium]|nr:50S ribosomal protein L17 [Deltaproteobacteria bacterium]MBI3293551.1 50S ribosomal protein L17 [Deltaproteobacteria bacterium]